MQFYLPAINQNNEAASSNSSMDQNIPDEPLSTHSSILIAYILKHTQSIPTFFSFNGINYIVFNPFPRMGKPVCFDTSKIADQCSQAMFEITESKFKTVFQLSYIKKYTDFVRKVILRRTITKEGENVYQKSIYKSDYKEGEFTTYPREVITTVPYQPYALRK